MNFITVSLLLMSLFSCGGGGGDKKTVPTYSISYIYPENTLSPGDGVAEVSPIAVKCLNNSNIEVDITFCGIDENFDLNTALKEIQKSPPGNVNITVLNSVEEEVVIFIEEGKTVADLTDEERALKLNGRINCLGPFEFTYKGSCETPSFEYKYGDFPENDLTPCEGSKTVTRSYECSSNITGVSTDESSCSHLTLDDSTVLFSPEGSSTSTLANGDVSLVNCLTGKTVSDIGNGSTVVSSISCGENRYIDEGVCIDDSFTAHGFVFPANDMEAGDGQRLVSATGFTLCSRLRDNSPVSLSLCSMPIPAPSENQESPAGHIDSLNVDGDLVRSNYLAGQTSPYSSEIISCGDVDSHIQNNGEVVSCEKDTFVASGFTFPANTLTPGQGQRTVIANGFDTCTNTTKTRTEPLAKCVMPAIIPEITQVSPAGDMDIAVANAVNGKVTVSVDEGFDYQGLLAFDKLTLIDSVLVCQIGYRKTFGACLGGVVEVFVGHSHSCALLIDYTVKCWGKNSYGQLGDGTVTDKLTPTPTLSLGMEVHTMSLGESHTCAVLMDSTVKCWGVNTHGQLGDGTTVDKTSPVLVPGLTGVREVKLGGSHSCALTHDGEVKCWGKNNRYQIGDSTTINRLSPKTVALSSPAKDLSVKGSHSCALLDSTEAKCWGWNYYGQLGDGTTTARTSPVMITAVPFSDIEKISLSGAGTCVMLIDNTVKCWGDNGTGQAGLDPSSGSMTLVANTMDFGGPVQSISSGNGFNCVLMQDRTVKCWGWNDWGSLGNNSIVTSFLPVPVEGLTDVESISLGDYSACAIKEGNSVFCWGWNYNGQLGVNHTNNALVPVPLHNSIYDGLE